MGDDKYQPCPCGSGKRFKFCCYEKRASLNNASDAELIRRVAEFPVSRCLVNSNWEDGIAQVLVVRWMPNSQYLVGVYLVDVFCLGVKDTFVRARFYDEDLTALLRRFPQRFGEIAYENARSMVLGAVEYARQLGFAPHEDWAVSRSILESDRSFNRKYQFGREGKPFYIQGPNDNAKKIMTQLEHLIKEGKADYIILADSDMFADGTGKLSTA
jgi:hypothetical protein